MNKKIEKVLNGRNGNYIFPFFWQHGESEEVLREYMKAIRESNIRAVCVESRPHPDFCGEKWWQDMDVILDEARKLGMKVWILDDSHFPTGFANGAMETQPDSLRRQSICCREYAVNGGEELYIEPDKISHPDPFEKNLAETYVLQDMGKTFEDDALLSLYAFREAGAEGSESEIKQERDVIDLAPYIRDGELRWTAPQGSWNVFAVHKSRNLGYHRSYINMMDKDSCRVLIDAVYEPHYEHYADDFGKTIAGFFSDEPELGNGHLYDMSDPYGSPMDYPWSREVEDRLREKLGSDFEKLLPLLWNMAIPGHSTMEKSADDTTVVPAIAAKMRYLYMDTVTSLVKENFSFQLGRWCRSHGVEYIGHVIEDDNHHSRTGSSLGHYFRGLAGQDMAGIDDIGGQVFPQGEDVSYNDGLFQHRNGEFYHYLLAKLASSAAAIEPLKKGNSMCEIFGNYGWEEGVHLEKYLADHFMVRGINHFVPHAFSAKEFPDPDCPPHFYAHGNNPQYRHFGCLMNYMNRICELLSDGRHIAPVAVIYHGEGDWTGNFMGDEQIGHILCDHQIDYDIIPQDVFADRDGFRTKVEAGRLKVNTQEYRAVLVPQMQYITTELAEAIVELAGRNITVYFVGGGPKGLCSTAMSLEETVNAAQLKNALESAGCVELKNLVQALQKQQIPEIEIAPADDRIRYYHYKYDKAEDCRAPKQDDLFRNGTEIYYFVNEGTKLYKGTVNFLTDKKMQANAVYFYDAWENRLVSAASAWDKDKNSIQLEVEPLKSVILVFDCMEKMDTMDTYFAPAASDYRENRSELCDFLSSWKRSVCRSIEYPVFQESREVTLPDRLAEEEPLFSGVVRYENRFEAKADDQMLLEITDACEGVEVFLNEECLGIQIVPVYRFDLSGHLRDGENRLRIEVATTLERQMSTLPDAYGRTKEPVGLTGITGEVKLWKCC
ncbi:MAG: hypothetical protein LIO99_04125 [Clostridiales bacterium]|nr:hypothetical protein [Clostridiales bacterium]